MDKNKLAEILHEATNAIEAYKKGQENKELIKEGASELILTKLLELRSSQLVKEAFELLPSGKTCPTCGGSGKI